MVHPAVPRYTEQMAPLWHTARLSTPTPSTSHAKSSFEKLPPWVQAKSTCQIDQSTLQNLPSIAHVDAFVPFPRQLEDNGFCVQSSKRTRAAPRAHRAAAS